MRYTVDAISGLLLGADTNTLEHEDDAIRQHLDAIIPALARRLAMPLPCTLARMIYLLQRHPQALQRATAEVRAVLGPDRVATTLEQAEALAWVEACCHETMRIKPVAPLTWPRPARTPVTPAGG
jgi:Cytochrome P450